MSVFSQLPKDIGTIISMMSPKVYFVLVRCSKAFALQTKYIQRHFTRRAISYGGDIMYFLPSGQLHNYGDVPAVTWDMDTYTAYSWYVCGKRQKQKSVYSSERVHLLPIQDENLGATISDVARYYGSVYVPIIRKKIVVSKQECKCIII